MPRIIYVTGKAGTGKSSLLALAAQTYAVEVNDLRGYGGLEGLRLLLEEGSILTVVIDELRPAQLAAVEHMAADFPRTFFILGSET